MKNGVDTNPIKFIKSPKMVGIPAYAKSVAKVNLNVNQHASLAIHLKMI